LINIKPNTALGFVPEVGRKAVRAGSAAVDGGEHAAAMPVPRIACANT
jgi:hypothetical protein